MSETSHATAPEAAPVPATARQEIAIDVSADDVWAAVSDVYRAHERLVPGMVVDTVRDGDTRIVTFANGAVASERVIGIDDAERRIVYGVIGNGLTFHEASMQVVTEGEGSRLIWTAAFLPRVVGVHLDQVMVQGIAVMKRTLEQAARA